MKFAWRALVLLGVAIALIAFNMDTTVGTNAGRVHNIGLQSQQQMLLILGGIAILAGVILFAVVKLKQTPEEEAKERAARQDMQDRAKERLQQLEEKVRGTLQRGEPDNATDAVSAEEKFGQRFLLVLCVLLSLLGFYFAWWVGVAGLIGCALFWVMNRQRASSQDA